MQDIILNEDEKKTLRSVQLEMLDEIVRICNENNLKYYLIGGTCLGAIRHKGFIPWDDDIDIALSRSDYNKLSLLCQSELHFDYFFQNNNTEKNHPQLFSRLRKNHTLFVEKRYKDFKLHHGIYIDIFPLDGMSNDFKTAEKHLNKINKYKTLLWLGNYRKRSFIKTVLQNLLMIYVKVVSREKIIKKVNIIEKKFDIDTSIFIGNMYGRWGMKETMDKEIVFGPENFAIFEGKEYRIPSDPEKYLESLYGDFMELPKIEDRVSHHGIIELSFNIKGVN